MEQRNERDVPDSKVAIVVTITIVALLLVGAEAWWLWPRSSTTVVRFHQGIITKRDFIDAHPETAATPNEAAGATRTPAELAQPTAPASEEKPKFSLDEPFRGIVVDPKEAPIAGATVQAMDWFGVVADKRATDAKGEFSFDRLTTNVRLLHASAPGHRALIVYVGDEGRWPRYPSVTIPARIVLEPGFVAVARLQWSDGTPCVGVAVHLGAAKLQTTGIDREPRIGPWPPPVTDANGRVEIDGLPPDRVIGLGIDLLGRNEDSPRPLETGHATSAAEATEQVFTWPKLAKLTVELRGLEEMAEKKLTGVLSIWRVDGFRGEAQQSVPPFTHTFDQVVLGGQYFVRLGVGDRWPANLASRLRIVDADQHVTFDCSLPAPRPPSSDADPPRFMAEFRLLHPDGSRITNAQLLDAGLESRGMNLRCGSLAANGKDAAVKSGLADLEDERGGVPGICGRLMVRERPPLWIEAELGSLRSRVEVEKAGADPRLDFTFDLAPLAIGLNRLTFRARADDGAEVQLDSVLLKATPSGAESMAFAFDAGPIWRMVRPGAYHYHCFAPSGGLAEGDVEVPAGSPVTVDVVIPEPGSICGIVAPIPDALRVLVTRSPLHGMRNRFNWWDHSWVGPDGSYSLAGIPPGEWRLMLSIVSADESTNHVEAVTVTVKSNAITRHDFVPMTSATKRIRLDFGKSERALLHVTDDHDDNLFDGGVANGTTVDVPIGALHFAATPEIRTTDYVNWDTDHWTEGAPSDGDGGATLVRFQFPER